MSSVPTPLERAVDITRLPSLPQILFQLLDACEADDSNMIEIANLIRQDAALATRVLAVSSSPVYARRRTDQRLSLEQSLVLLGLNTLRTLALAATVYQYLEPSLGVRASVQRHFWHDALLAATLAGKLAKLSGYAATHEAYLGGLISNVGQIGLLALDPQRYGELLEKTSGDPESLIRQEGNEFGLDHAELGALMLQQAGRKGPLTDAVRFHHAATDELTGAHHLVRLVAVANRLVATGRAPDTEGLVAADQVLGLLPGLLGQVYDAAEEETQITAKGLGIDLSAPPAETAGPLAQETRDLALRLGHMNVVSAVRRQLAESDDLHDLLAAAHLAGTLLFGIHEIGFFLLDRQATGASGYAVDDDAGVWPELTLSLPTSGGLIGKVLTEGVSGCHYPWHADHPRSVRPNVIDNEVLSLLNRQGLLAMPLKSDRHVAGALLIGMDPVDESRLDDRSALLTLFARQVGESMDALRQRVHRNSAALEAQAEEFHLRARSAVHEANNPLSIIKNYLGILGHHVENGSPDAVNDIRVIDEEIARVGAILRSLTEATAESTRDDVADVNALIGDVVNLLKPTLITPGKLNLELNLEESIPAISASRNSIKQVLVNLIKNAAEALGRDRTISVRTEDGIYVSNQAYIGIDIADDGEGIPSQVLANLFEPVASTKGRGHSGLGLSITKRLVDGLNGSITCRSGARGTRFQILLPRKLPDA